MKKLIEISKPYLGQEEIDAVIGVLKSGFLAQGPKVKELEEKFADYCGTKYAVAMINGTVTLHSSLYALGIGQGDEVITTALSFISTANAILMQGAHVVFADIESATFNIDPAKIEEKITKKTKAIMPVDLYGHMYDVGGVHAIAKKYDHAVVEDAAQSVAAEYKKKKAGSVADVGSFSLYATKNLTAGLGGMITTNDKKVMEYCKHFRHHGQPEDMPYEYVYFGYNYRMMDVIAVIALEQLKKIERFTQIRRRNAKLLSKGLANIEGLILPIEKPGFRHVYHQYTIRITKNFKVSRDAFITHMAAHGITCRIYYPKPLHLYPHLQKRGFKKGDFPIAEKLTEEIVSLPVHPLVSEDEIQFITDTIRKI